MLPKISATVEILTYNNEATIEKTLKSVFDFGEILVIDGGSTDQTREIAQRFGARIIEQSNAGRREGRIVDFSLMRNQGLDAAMHQWFLFVDSDELFTEELVAEIRSVISLAHPHYFIWRVPRKYVYRGRIIDCATTYPNTQFRFFHRAHVVSFVKEVHERILPRPGETVGVLRSAMLVPIPESGALWAKWQRYVAIEEARLCGTSRREILEKIFDTLKAIAVYGLRLPQVLICQGHRLPLWYELLQQRYQFALLRMLFRNLL